MENGKSQNTFSAYTDLRPKRYKFLEELGEGGFGMVLKCLDTDTRDIKAVKLPKHNIIPIEEITILRQLININMDDCNIVEFYGCFNITLGPALVFENLDIALADYLVDNISGPMLVNDIRIITKQIATALNALQSIGVIHADIKPDNIMLVDQTRPLKVKLIDFGSALERSQARPGMSLQTICFRAPEIILGLPFSEAIDMWALGQLVFTMLFKCLLIRARSEYEAMKLIVDLLGVPSDDLLNRGIRAHIFFIKTESDTWRLKTPEEYPFKVPDITENGYTFSCLDDLKTLYREKRCDNVEAGQAEQCIELLKAMMMMDESQRITPLGVLSHPFFTQDNQQDHQDQQDNQDDQDLHDNQDLQDHQDAQDQQDDQDLHDNQDHQDNQDQQDQQDDQDLHDNQDNQDAQEQQDAQDQQDLHDNQDYQDDQDLEDHQDQQDQKRTTDEGTISPPTTPPSREIQVQSAAAENTLQLEDEERADSLQDGPKETLEVSCDKSPTQSPAMTSEDSEDEQQMKKKKKKKKKNICKRIWSWMKRTFCCNRVGVVGIEEGKK